MWATLQPNWATFSARTFVQFCQMPECRTVWYRNKGTPVRYRNVAVPDWDAGCRNTDAGGIGLDADAQLCQQTNQGRTPSFVLFEPLFTSVSTVGKGHHPSSLSDFGRQWILLHVTEEVGAQHTLHSNLYTQSLIMSQTSYSSTWEVEIQNNLYFSLILPIAMSSTKWFRISMLYLIDTCKFKICKYVAACSNAVRFVLVLYVHVQYLHVYFTTL